MTGRLDMTELARKIYSGTNSGTSTKEWKKRRRKLKIEVTKSIRLNYDSPDTVAKYIASIDALADKSEAYFGKKPPVEVHHIGGNGMLPSGSDLWYYIGIVAVTMVVLISPQAFYVSYVSYWPTIVFGGGVVLAGILGGLVGGWRVALAYAVFSALFSWFELFYDPSQGPQRLIWVTETMEQLTKEFAPLPTPAPEAERRLSEILEKI